MKPWDGGAIEARGVGYPHVKISCLVPLRTSMSREPEHKTLRACHLFLNGWGTDAGQLGRCHYC
jgi:hypothetical protein